MRTDISSTITDAMDSDSYELATQVYVQPNLPDWSEAIAASGPSNPIGHDAIYLEEDDGTRHLFRARSGSDLDNTDHKLYVSHTTGEDVDDPDSWSAFVEVGTDVARPMATASYPNITLPGQVSIVGDLTGLIQVFCWKNSSASLKCYRSTDWGANWSLETVTNAPSGSSLYTSAMLVAADAVNSVYFTAKYSFPTSAVHTSVNYEVICHFTYSGSWAEDTTAGENWLLKGKWKFKTSTRNWTWPEPVWAGLGTFPFDDRVVVVGGPILEDALAMGGSQQGVFSFIHHESGLWWMGNGVNLADYTESYRYSNAMCRGSMVNGQGWVTFLSEEEPTDIYQTTEYEVVPRKPEIVFARTKDGKNYTEAEPILVENAVDFGVPKIVYTGTKLFAISWSGVLVSDPCYIVDPSSGRTDITDEVSAWVVSQTGRTPDNQVNLTIPGQSSHIEAGDVITIEAGAEGETAQIAVAYVDEISTSYSVRSGTWEQGVVALTSKALVDKRCHVNTDMLPQDRIMIVPTSNDQWAIDLGNWSTTVIPKPSVYVWSTLHDAARPDGQALSDRQFLYVSSHSITNHWMHQIAYFIHPERLNSQIEAWVRMGDYNFWGTNETSTVKYTTDVGYTLRAFSDMVNGYQWRWGETKNSSTHSWGSSGFRQIISSTYPQVWNTQCYSSIGIAIRATHAKQTLVFAWEGGVQEWTTDTTMGFTDNIDRIDGGTPSELSSTGNAFGVNNPMAAPGNKLVLYRFDSDSTSGDPDRKILAYYPSSGPLPVSLGDIIKIKVVVHYGTIYCYYRSEMSPTWIKAIEYSDAIFGAGRFGFYGRGFRGGETLWFDHGDIIPSNMTNTSCIWDATISDFGPEITIEDVVKRLAWSAGVEVVTKAEADDDTTPTEYSNDYDTTVQVSLLNGIGATDCVIDEDILFDDGEAGYIVRATDRWNFVAVGITPGAAHTAKVTLYYGTGDSGTHTMTAVEASPIWFNVSTTKYLPVRISVQDDWFAVWIGNLLAGTFYFQYKNYDGWGGVGLGLLGTSSRKNLHLSELDDVPFYATLDSNQLYGDAIAGFLNQRRVKLLTRYDGVVTASRFFAHDSAGDISHLILDNSMVQTDKGISHCRVLGAAGWGEYKSNALSSRGRRFVEANMPDAMTRDNMYKEARAMVLEANELARQDNLVCLPDLTLEAEDVVTIVSPDQGINGDYIIDNLSLGFSNGVLQQQIGTRQRYVE